VITLGVILLILGIVLGHPVLWVLGILLGVFGLTFSALGAVGQTLFGRRHFF
jgi:hypothetical protein